MANRVNLVLKSTTPNKLNSTTTLTYLNPEATNAQLVELAKKINALTTGTATLTITKVTQEVLV